MRRPMNPPAAPPPKGPYSIAVEASGGRLLFMTGQVSKDAAGHLVGEGDPAAQARQIVANLRSIAAAAGGSLSDIASWTWYDTDIAAHREALRNAFTEAFPDADYPAFTRVQVVALERAEYLMKADAIAVLA